VFLSLCYVVLRRILQLAVLHVRSNDFKDLEIVVLRHELGILRRRIRRPAMTWIDRLFLVAASPAAARWRSFIITPGTLLRIRRHDRGDAAQAATTQLMSAHREPTAFFVSQADPAAHVSTKDAVFFDQVRHGHLLPLVEPADQRGQEDAERHGVEHGARVYTTEPIPGPRRPSAEQ
jgi:hypothetical protein